MRVFWITAAVMQLAAAIAYAAVGFGVVFALLELFVAATFALTVLEMIGWHHHPLPRSGHIRIDDIDEWSWR